MLPSCAILSSTDVQKLKNWVGGNCLRIDPKNGLPAAFTAESPCFDDFFALHCGKTLMF